MEKMFIWLQKITVLMNTNLLCWVGELKWNLDLSGVDSSSKRGDSANDVACMWWSHLFTDCCHLWDATHLVSLSVGALNCSLTTDMCHVGKLYFLPSPHPTHPVYIKKLAQKSTEGGTTQWLTGRCKFRSIYSVMRQQWFEAQVSGFLSLAKKRLLKQPLQLMQPHRSSCVNMFLSSASRARTGARQRASHSHLQSILDEDMRVGIDCNFLQCCVPLSCFIRRLIPISCAVGQPRAPVTSQDNH